jgi:hypothetical protein
MGRSKPNIFEDKAEEEPRKKRKGEYHETSFEMMKPEAGSSLRSSFESKSSESVSEGSRSQKETASDSKLPIPSRKEELRTKFDKDKASLEGAERKMGSVSTLAARLVTPGVIEKRRNGPREAESSPDVVHGKGQKEHDVVRKLELPGYPVDEDRDDAVLQGYLMEHLSSEKKSSPLEKCPRRPERICQHPTIISLPSFIGREFRGTWCSSPANTKKASTVLFSCKLSWVFVCNTRIFRQHFLGCFVVLGWDVSGRVQTM